MTKQSSKSAYGQDFGSTPATQRALIPFDQASKRGIEPGPSWEVEPGSKSLLLGPAPIPAQGYLRFIEVEVSTVTEGEEEGGNAFAEDGPWNIFEQIREQDTNGNQLGDNSGYAQFLDNVFGGYSGQPDPRVDIDYLATVKKPHTQILLARELAPNGFGSLSNMSASQAYKLTLRIAPSSVIWTSIKKVPKLKISTWIHYWQLPEPEDMEGNKQVDEPPYSGTAQYRWFSPANSTAKAFNLKLTQVGNVIRQIILVGRESGTRKNKVFPEVLNFRWDTDILLICGQPQLRKIAKEMVPNMSTWPEGVIPLLFDYGEGRVVGGTGVNSYLPTVTASRLEIYGTSEAAGEIDVYTNDVSIAQIVPALRPQSPGVGGYQPPVAPRIQGAR